MDIVLLLWFGCDIPSRYVGLNTWSPAGGILGELVGTLRSEVSWKQGEHHDQAVGSWSLAGSSPVPYSWPTMM